MINPINKEMCTGCCACLNVCPKHCITMERDGEGFWYPSVDRILCDNCGLCEHICPLIEGNSFPLERLPDPMALAVWNTDHAIRIDSTSGGVFSALAERIFARKGFVAGAVYEDDHTVSHIITGDSEKLTALRSSKYLQSYTGELFNTIMRLLEDGKEVLICGTPCQIAGLYNVLGKDYEGLITCDFICRGVNSPKVFVRYIEMLEAKYHAPAIHIKFKNKTYGWHRFSTRIDFANGKTYIKDREHDPFMVGYLQYNCFVRPSCYSCRFKNIPRQADITLADFWGLDKIHPEWDNDCGTSAVILNSEKGRRFFHDVGDGLSAHKCAIEDIAAGNLALKQSIERKLGREQFFGNIDNMPFDKLCRKFFPLPKRMRKTASWITVNAKKTMRRLLWGLQNIGLAPSAWLQLIHINMLRKNTHADIRRAKMIIPTRYCRVVMDASAKIVFNGMLLLGLKRIRQSKIETRLSVGKGASLIINGNFTAVAGVDVRVFDNAVLTLNSGFCNEDVQITCAKKITIGSGCAIARDVVIRDCDGHQLMDAKHEKEVEIRIGDHVWIGNRAIILKGVTIGAGAVVAAGAIVTKDIPAKCLAAGVPAKIIRENVEWR